MLTYLPRTLPLVTNDPLPSYLYLPSSPSPSFSLEAQVTSLRKDLEGRQEQLERSHAQLVELQNKYDVCPKPEVVERYVEGWGGRGGMGRRERYLEGWGEGRGMWRDGEEGEGCGGGRGMRCYL